MHEGGRNTMKTLVLALLLVCGMLVVTGQLSGADLKLREVDHGASRVLLFDPETGWECWVEEGDEFKGWFVYEITPTAVYLNREVSPGYEELVEYPLQGSIDVIEK